MSFTKFGALVGAFALTASVAATPMPTQAQSTPEQAQRYIVVLNGNVGRVPDVASKMASQHGLKVGHQFGRAIKGFSVSGPKARVQTLTKDSRVAFISEDLPVSAAVNSNGKGNNGNGKGNGKPKPTPTPAPAQQLPTGVDRVNAELNSNQGAGSTVAILDTGIDTDHPDLVNNIVATHSCMKKGKPTPEDDNGHGTHIAGTIAAANNFTGVVGVASEAGLVAVKVLDKNANGYWSDVICGIDWVTANAATYGINVVNMSLSGPGANDNNCGMTNNDAMHQAICSSVAQGITYVVSAGNDNLPVNQFVPAAYDDAVITVSALVDTDGQAGGLGSSTSSGADDTFASYSNYGSSVDIGAPGELIHSTWLNGGYRSIGGTSMAAPHVAGAAALYLTSNPGASWLDVRSNILLQAFTTGYTSSTQHSEPVLNAETL